MIARVFIYKFSILVFLNLSNLTVAGQENPNIGARATSMGGNYRSIATDWSAMYWNPAGLSFLQGWSTGFSLEYIMLRPSFKPGDSHYFNLNGGESFQPFSATYTTTRDGEPLNFFVPSIGISYSPDGKWAFGLGMWVPMALGVRWDLLDTHGSTNGKGIYNTAYPDIEYEVNMQVIDLQPTVSYRINDKLSAGIGIGILFGKLGIRRPAYLQNPYLYDETLYNTLLSISDQTQTETLDQMRLPPFDHLVNEIEMKGSGVTFGGNFGLMYKPTEKLSIGATIQVNKELKISGDYKQTAYFGDNEDFDALTRYYDERIFARLFNNGLLDEQNYQVISRFYSGQVLSLENTKASTKVPLPVKAGMGISYSGVENLILAADVNFMKWSSWDTLPVRGENNVRISELVLKWKNSIKAGVGAEYKSKIATFRTGFSIETHPPIDETISPAIPEIGHHNNFDIGIAFNLFGGLLSINYHKIFIAERTVENWTYDQMGVALNMAGTYTMNVQSLMIGYDYKF